MSQFLISDAIPFTTMVMTMIAMWIHRHLRVICTREEAMIDEKSKSGAGLINKKMSTDE